MQRLLRVAAAAVMAVAVAAAILPILWQPTWAPSSGDQPILFMHYYIDAAGIVAGLLVAAGAVLVLIALARILDRLDDIRSRIGRDRG